MSPPPVARLSRESTISLGMACSAMAACAAGAIWIGTRLTSIESAIVSLQREQVSRATIEALALRYAIENPGARVPDPSNPGHVIVVNARPLTEVSR